MWRHAQVDMLLGPCFEREAREGGGEWWRGSAGRERQARTTEGHPPTIRRRRGGESKSVPLGLMRNAMVAEASKRKQRKRGWTHHLF